MNKRVLPYNLYDEITLRTKDGETRALITREENEDGLIEVQTAKPIDGKIIHLFTREQLDDMSTTSPHTKEEDLKGSGNSYMNTKKEVGPKRNTASKIHEKFLSVLSSIGCLAIIIVPICFIVIQCSEKRREDNEKHFAQTCMAIQDSLKKAKHINSPEYLDSVRCAEERHQKWKTEWEQKEKIHNANDIIGIYYLGEDKYHNHFHDYFQKADIGSLEFVTENMVKRKGLSLCEECDTYITPEDIDITNYYTKDEIIEIYDISKYDFEY